MAKNTFLKTSGRAKELGRKGGLKNKGRQSQSTVAKIEAREVLRKLIEAETVPLFEAWKDSALGHFIQVTSAAGLVKVYKEAPNGVAIRDMFERAFGKPEQKSTVDMTVTSTADNQLDSVLAEMEAAILIEDHENDDATEDSDVAADGEVDTGERTPIQSDPSGIEGQA